MRCSRGLGVDRAHEVLERQRKQADVADVFNYHKSYCVAGVIVLVGCSRGNEGGGCEQ
jgi:hypothetical protein